MHLVDYSVGSILAFSGLTGGLGAAMLALPPVKERVVRVLFWAAALSFGSSGIVWSATSEGHSLAIQMLVSFLVGGTAASGLVWGLWEIRNRVDPAPVEHSKKAEATMHSSGKNSPHISAGGNVTIGDIGDVINSAGASTPKRPPDEKLPGFTSGMVVQTDDVQAVRKKYQYAFGAPEGAKVAFYLSASNRYAFSVTDVNGEEYKLDIPLGANGLPFGKWAYISCVVGTASSYSYLRAMLNGKEVARRDLDFPIDLGSRKWMPVLGSDPNGQNGGAFMMMEMGAYATSLTDAELMALATNALNAYGLKP